MRAGPACRSGMACLPIGRITYILSAVSGLAALGILRIEGIDRERLAVLFDRDVDRGEPPVWRLHHQLDRARSVRGTFPADESRSSARPDGPPTPTLRRRQSAARTTRKTRNFIKARIPRIIARGSAIGVVYISAIRVRYLRAPRGSMLKKLLVALAFCCPVPAGLGGRSGATRRAIRGRASSSASSACEGPAVATTNSSSCSTRRRPPWTSADGRFGARTTPARTAIGPRYRRQRRSVPAATTSRPTPRPRGTAAASRQRDVHDRHHRRWRPRAEARPTTPSSIRSGMSAGSAFGEGTRLATFGATNRRSRVRAYADGREGLGRQRRRLRDDHAERTAESRVGRRMRRAAGRSGRRGHQSGLRRRREQRVGLHQRLHRDLQSRSRSGESRRLVGAVPDRAPARRGR